MFLTQKQLKRAIFDEKTKISPLELFLSSAYTMLLLTMVKGIVTSFKGSVKVAKSLGGVIACTDASTVFVSVENALTENLNTVETHMVLCGLVLHECGHILFTDFELSITCRERMKKGDIYPPPLENPYLDEVKDFLKANQHSADALYTIYHRLDNCIEDGFVDRIMKFLIPGYGKCLSFVAKIDNEFTETYKEMVDKGLPEQAIFSNLVLAYARHGELVFDEDDEQEELIKAFLETTDTIKKAVFERNAHQRKRYTFKVFCYLFHFVKMQNEKQQPQNGAGGNNANEKSNNDSEKNNNGSEGDGAFSKDGASGEKEENNGGSSTKDENHSSDTEENSEDSSSSSNASDDEGKESADSTGAEDNSDASSEKKDNEDSENSDSSTEKSDQESNENSEENSSSTSSNESSEKDSGDNSDTGSDANQSPAAETEDNASDSSSSSTSDESSSSQGESSGESKSSTGSMSSNDSSFDNSSDETSGDSSTPSLDDLFNDLADNMADSEKNEHKNTADNQRSANSRELSDLTSTMDNLSDKEQDALSNHDREDTEASEASPEIERMLDKMAEEKIAEQQEREIKRNSKEEIRDIMQNSDYHKNISSKFTRLQPDEYSAQCYEEHKTELNAIVRRFIKDFKFEIEDRQRGDTLTGLYNGKRLKANNAYRHDKRIFSSKIAPEDIPDMAIGIMIDCSGSMGGRRIETARKCAYITYKFCKELNIPVFIIGHDTYGGTVNLYSAVDDKSLDKKDEERIFSLQAGGCNRDGFALRYCLNKLKKIQADQKIMFVISDGQPNHYGYNLREGRIDCQDAVRSAIKDGIITIAAGIGDVESVRNVYNHGISEKNSAKYLDLSDLKRLPKAFIKIIKEHLK